MPLIRIQERPGEPDGPNAIVSFNNGPEYPITINNPFEQQEELEWDFEEQYRTLMTTADMSLVQTASRLGRTAVASIPRPSKAVGNTLRPML